MTIISTSSDAADTNSPTPWGQISADDIQSNLEVLGVKDQEDGDDRPKGFSLDLAKRAGFQNGVVPETEEDLEKAEQVLSNELAKLSMNEHEQAMFDVVGFRHIKEEDDTFLNTKLAELDQRLHKISGGRTRAYEAACQLNPEYVQGKTFRLAFLRTQRFDAKKAATAIISHFHIKRKVFANYEPGFLAREMKFTDLSPDAREIVEAGYFQVSPSKDAAGRTVLFFAAALNKYRTMESLKQAFWYFIGCISRNEEAQTTGVVGVAYSGGKPEKMAVAFELQKMKYAFAMDIQAAHLCETTMAMRFLVAAQKLYVDNFTRFRMQEHSGTREEIHFALQTYGINTDDSPLKSGNTLDTTFHKKWLEAQKHYEENSSRCQATLVPRRFDVLFGRSKRCMQHPGTMRCQLLVDMHWEEYEGQNKLERGLIAEKIVRMVHESGGRFLKWNGNKTAGAWEEVDDNAARAKVTHFFRGIRERKQKSSKTQANGSASKRGIDNGNETDTSESMTSSSSTELSSSSVFSKRMRAPGMDDISETLEA